MSVTVIRLQLIVLSSIFLVASVFGAEEKFADQWNRETDGGRAFECERVVSQDRMREVLRQAGWPMDTGIPIIDWRSNDAIIVKPSYYYKTGRLRFLGLFRISPHSVHLRYGWIPIKESEQRGASSTTIGSVGEGHPAVIVVAYRKGMDGGAITPTSGMACVDVGFQQ